MILEGLVTTLNANSSVHLSAMGPRIDDDWRTIVLRPYRGSTTLANLERHGVGVLHVTDDVELIARAAIGRVESLPLLTALSSIAGFRLVDTCRWLAFRVTTLDARLERAEIVAEVIETGAVREFFGFNRGKHAVVEAAILATRTAFLPRQEIEDQLERLRPLVEKTGGPAEARAFALLAAHIAGAYAAQKTSEPTFV